MLTMERDLERSADVDIFRANERNEKKGASGEGLRHTRGRGKSLPMPPQWSFLASGRDARDPGNGTTNTAGSFRDTFSKPRSKDRQAGTARLTEQKAAAAASTKAGANKRLRVAQGKAPTRPERKRRAPEVGEGKRESKQRRTAGRASERRPGCCAF